MTVAADAGVQVGDIAREAHVNIQTVRHYERRGLLLPHSRFTGGYRLYTIDAVRVVRFIKRAQALAFSLDEVAELLDLRAMRADRIATCAPWRPQRSPISMHDCRG